MALTPQDIAQVRRMIGQAAASLNPESVDEVRRDFYIYEAEALGLAPAASANDIINIEADSDFILQKFAYHAVDSAATDSPTDSTRFWPNITIQLVDSGSGRQLMQNPIPVTSFYGNGELPFILPNPRKFLRNSTIQVAFTSFEPGGGTTFDLRLAFIGYKIYGTQ